MTTMTRKRGRPGYTRMWTALLDYAAGRPVSPLPEEVWSPERLFELLVEIDRVKSDKNIERRVKNDRELAETIGMSYSNFRRRRREAERLMQKVKEWARRPKIRRDRKSAQ